MKIPRRKILQMGCSVGITSLAGCNSLNPPQLSLELLNYTSEPHTIDLKIFRVDRNQYSEATVHSDLYKLSARGEDPSVNIVEEIVEARAYLIQVQLLDYDVSAHYHFYPDCRSDSERPDRVGIRVHQNEVQGRYIEFDQNRCG